MIYFLLCGFETVAQGDDAVVNAGVLGVRGKEAGAHELELLTVAGWIIQAGGMGSYNRNMNQTAGRAGGVAGGVAGAAAGNVVGRVGKLLK